MAVNRYPGTCHVCKGPVEARAGLLMSVPGRRARVPVHLACESAGEPAVVTFYSPVTGATWTRNAAGTCEDAPCCGCCS